VLRESALPDKGAHINLADFYLVVVSLGLVLAFGVGLGFVDICSASWWHRQPVQCGWRTLAGIDWDVEVACAKDLTKHIATTNHAECNANPSNSSATTSIKTTERERKEEEEEIGKEDLGLTCESHVHLSSSSTCVAN
jgi:hypothetical protein